jgi:hypothetical protein
MIAIDIYKPELFHDFFVMVGGATASLTGLVFVAMSLNLEAVVGDATHRNRAVGTIAGFTAVFILCGLALIGKQNNISIGIEWLVISSITAYIYINGYVQAVKGGGSPSGLSLPRMMFGVVCYLAQIAGSVLLMLGYICGLYLAAGAMMIFFASLISGAWLLLVGICNEKKGHKKAKD